jgi:drug/metabolite transporter (DMT)-like permease
VLNITPSDYTPLEPFKAFYREKGSRIMLLVSFMYSLAAVIGKKAILHSSVMLFTITFFLTLNILAILIMEAAGRGTVNRLLRKPYEGSVAGVLFFIHLVCHGWAVSMTKAVYMIAVKRMSILFGVLYGAVLFKEKHFMYRFTGAALMIAGATIISLKGV